MNLITFNSATCMYPNATLIHHHCFLLPLTPATWQSAPPYPTIQLANGRKIFLTCHTKPLFNIHQCRDIGIDVERHMGDDWSWTIDLNAQGEVLHEVGSWDKTEDEHYMRKTKWVMKFYRNVPKVHIACAQTVSSRTYVNN